MLTRGRNLEYFVCYGLVMAAVNNVTIIYTARADQGSDQCDLPGCTWPKRKKQDGTVHDYCSRDHANQDAPNHDGKNVFSIVSYSLHSFPFSKNAHSEE